jgi:hypothetical protein
MDVSYTFDPDTGEQQLMVCATQDDWAQLLRNLDGIGHLPATLKLIDGLKSWGVRK